MVTTSTPSPDSPPLELPQDEQSGFFGLLVKSVFEPGVNPAVVMAMNLSFFFLVLVLFALAVLTSWNKHVLILMGCSTVLWGTMIWFVVELTRVQTRPDNLPPNIDEAITSDPGLKEDKKDR